MEKVDIIKDVEFFKRLKELGIVKQDKPVKNLCKFLCIDDNYQNSLMAKKLFKAFKDFSDSYFLTLLGFKKVKIPVQFEKGNSTKQLPKPMAPELNQQSLN